MSRLTLVRIRTRSSSVDILQTTMKSRWRVTEASTSLWSVKSIMLKPRELRPGMETKRVPAENLRVLVNSI